MVSDSSTITHIHTRARAHTHTYTHTHARRRADAHFWRAGVCRAGGVVGPWQFRAGAGGKESTRAPPDEPGCSGEKPAASATGRRGTSRAPNSGARPITSAASASFYSQRGLPFPGCLALNPHFAPLGRPPSSPRRAPLRASGGPAHLPGAAETPPPAAAAGRSGSSSPLSPAAAAAAAGASPSLPGRPYVLFTRMARALSGEPTPEMRGLRRATTCSAISVSWKLGGAAGAAERIFPLFSCRGGWLFCPELAGARGAPGPGRSVPEPASAVGSPASGQGGGSAGKRRVGGLESQAGQSSFP